MEDYYPNWLGRDLLSGELPWEKSVEAGMPAFLEQYSLHDSYWIGIHLQPSSEAVALIRWDTYWSEGRVPYPGDQVSAWPILLIRFERVYGTLVSYLDAERASVSGLSETIADAESEWLSPSQREKLLDHALAHRGSSDAFDDFLLDDTLHRTTFSPVFRSFVQIWHAGATQFLCLNEEKSVLPIPSLRP